VNEKITIPPFGRRKEGSHNRFLGLAAHREEAVNASPTVTSLAARNL